MVLAVSPVSPALKFPPDKFEEATCVPVPSGKLLVVLYSIPYAVTLEQPVAVIEPAAVAVVCVIALAAPVVTEAVVLTPEPAAATFTGAAIPPPSTGTFPL